MFLSIHSCLSPLTGQSRGKRNTYHSQCITFLLYCYFSSPIPEYGPSHELQLFPNCDEHPTGCSFLRTALQDPSLRNGQLQHGSLQNKQRQRQSLYLRNRHYRKRHRREINSPLPVKVWRKGRAEECSLLPFVLLCHRRKGWGKGEHVQTQIAHALPEASLRQKGWLQPPYIFTDLSTSTRNPC